MDLDVLLSRAKAGQVPMPELIEALKGAELLIALRSFEGESGELLVIDQGGQSFGVVYTSRSHLDEHAAAEKFLVRRGSDLREWWPEATGLAINPADVATTVALGPTAVSALSGEPSGDSPVVSVGAPAQDPSAGLKRAISESRDEVGLSSVPAYLFQMHDDVNGSRLVLGLTTEAVTGGQRVVPQLGEALSRRLDQSEVLDIMLLSPDLLGIVEKYVPALGRA